jgi:hypothetical protein
LFKDSEKYIMCTTGYFMFAQKFHQKTFFVASVKNKIQKIVFEAFCANINLIYT